MRLFRQTARNDWSSVLEQLNSALNELFQLDMASLFLAKGLKYAAICPTLNGRSTSCSCQTDGIVAILVRRHLEEEIIRLVNLPTDFLVQALGEFCGDQDQTLA